jgi:hypothetical protein
VSAYVIPHEAYLKACADALDAAGIPVEDWSGEDDSLSVGWIDLDPEVTAAVYGSDRVVLVWSEERGWSAGWGASPSSGSTEHGVEQLVDLSIGVLPTPAELVEATRGVVAEIPAPDAGPYGRYRNAGDSDDLAAQLATYRQTAGGRE